ncbi:MAG: phage terminase large subunit [Candidatus Pacebacteria bacterium]|nr:phage terminase large subunit [Candidatus Paceibacterota bacterium]
MKNTYVTEIIDVKLFNKMMKDKAIRIAITKESFLYFFHFYYSHYVKYKTADFQKEIIHNLEKSPTENMYVCAFRGSAKSTLVTSSYPIWAILGKQQKKFCVIFCQTQTQAKQHMMNIKQELEENDLLKKDLGPFSEDSDEWGSRSLVFKKNGARITVASTEQSIRGLRHNEHRPDLIICDDVEDVQSTRTRESREKTYNWLRGEVMPSGDKNTRLIIVGNLLHEDSLLMRIKEEVELGKTKGTFKEYPLLDSRGESLWPGKYGSIEELDKEQEKIANDILWQREFLLKIVPTDEQVIHREWIKYYDNIPNKKDEYGYSLNRGTRIGVDLAISQKETADYTSMVVGKIVGEGREAVLYICPDMINKKLTFPETVVTCKRLHEIYKEPIFIIEDVAYQKALPQQLKEEGLHQVRSIRPTGDKRTRLMLVSNFIKTGRVMFPSQGAEQLINQIVNFGVEKHDDLADALSILILDFIENPVFWARIMFI